MGRLSQWSRRFAAKFPKAGLSAQTPYTAAELEQAIETAGSAEPFAPLNPDYAEQGLTGAEVRQRQAAGRVNQQPRLKSRSYGQIIFQAVFSYFNLLNFMLAAVLLIVVIPNPRLIFNMAFFLVAVWNTLVKIFQECRSKHVLDQLSLLSQPEVNVLRDGVLNRIAPEELLQDDLVYLKGGNQPAADGVVIRSQACEVDESLLTGESQSVSKAAGDSVFAGTIIQAGYMYARMTQIGQTTVASRITARAAKERRKPSELIDSLDKLVKGISKIILPLGVLLFLKHYFLVEHLTLTEGISSTVADLVSMIPEGLILLSSVTFVVSTLKLVRQKTLLQNMSAIESLARVDTLCLDKTGTITTGKLVFQELKPLIPPGSPIKQPPLSYESVLRQFALYFPPANSTQQALNQTFLTPDRPASESAAGRWPVKNVIAFSSARKWSALSFTQQGNWYLGAPDILLQAATDVAGTSLQAELERCNRQGLRSLLLACQIATPADSAPEPESSEAADRLPAGSLLPCALLLLADELRADSRKTLAYYREQGVTIKILSGDNAQAAAAVARRAGITDSDRYIDVSQLPEGTDWSELAGQYTIFGRVSPFQKEKLLQSLHSLGHKVAMVGDGSNDVLALREADCGVAMASGSDAARLSADIILLDNNIQSLVPAVYEGRSVINNVKRLSTLFLVRTTYAIIMAFLMLLSPLVYPLYPIQASLISGATVGIPSFFLALKPNYDRVSAGFLDTVLPDALPVGLTVVVSWSAIQIAGGCWGWSYTFCSTLSFLALSLVGLLTLYRVSRPLDTFRIILDLLCSVYLGVAAWLLPDFFMLSPLQPAQWLEIVLPLLLFTLLIYGLFSLIARQLRRLGHRWFKWRGRSKPQPRA
ncbi:HAD-IC family P-type ATPase [Oscillospiraceae bacterium HV4-5-C5C]|nr:HAD-IC family P-type ATPase [Oscillospiraceae bacterium HV4-5-C5C]